MPQRKINMQIQEKLALSGLREMASRSRIAGLFHVLTFSLTLFLTPLRFSHEWLCILLFSVLFICSTARTIICFSKLTDKDIHSRWKHWFTILTTISFTVWSVWITLQVCLVGLESSTHFSLLIMVGVCAGGVMGLTPSRALMTAITLIALVPASVALALENTKEAYVMAFMLLFNIAFILGQAKRMNQHFQDAITNRDIAELNRQTIETVLDSIPGFVSCVNERLEYVWSNKKLGEKFGVKITNYVNRLGDFNVADNFPDVVRGFIRSGKQIDQFEYEMTFPDGTCWMMIFLSRYQEFGQERVLIISHDIQDLKTSEQELQRQRSLAIESSKLATLGEMSAGIAHEINNPLSVMMSRAEVMMEQLKEGGLPVELAISSLEKIHKNGERISKIVRGLRTFSRNGENDPLQTVRVLKLVDDVLDFAREKFKLNNIDLKVEVDSEISFECRPTQIEQVLLNLLNNSFDAVLETPNAWVLIKAHRKDNQVIITITDSGGGIAPHLWSKIMQPFYTTKEVGKGTGLGLSISMGIVRSHGGDLYYDPKSKNTQFVIQIPVEHRKVA